MTVRLATPEATMLSSEATPTDDAARIMDSVRRLVRELRVAARAAESELGVSTAQLFVLRQLQAHAGQSLSDVAEHTRTTQSSVSEVVARLIRRGLVERHPSTMDRRRAELSITDQGRAVIASAPVTIQERLLAGLAHLDEGQRRALAAGMDAWLRASGLSEVRPTMFFEPERAKKPPLR